MTDIQYVQFTGTFYMGGGLICRKPGVYKTSKEFADFLVENHDNEFSLADAPEAEAPESTDAPETAKADIPLSRMNKTQLLAKAEEIGLAVTDDMDTNAKLAEAIKQHEEAKAQS